MGAGVLVVGLMVTGVLVDGVLVVGVLVLGPAARSLLEIALSSNWGLELSKNVPTAAPEAGRGHTTTVDAASI